MFSKVEVALARNFASVSQAQRNACSHANISSLKNGTRVVSEASQGETVSLSAWVAAGSRDDVVGGSANLLGRVASKGTKKRNPQQLRTDIQNLGGSFSGKVTREHTIYKLDVLKSDVGKAVELLADIIQNPNLDDNAVAAERSAVVGGNLGYLTGAESDVSEHLHEAAFHNSGLGRPLNGGDSAANLNKGDLQAFLQSNYTGDRFVIAGAGNVEHKQLAELVERHFVSAAGTGKSRSEQTVFVGSDKRIRMDSFKRASVSLAFKSYGHDDANVYPLLVMQKLLGQWNRLGLSQLNSASKLAQEVAEHEIAHSFHAFNNFYRDTGLFGVHIVADDNKLDDAMHVAIGNMVRLCHNVSDEEVERAKAQLTTTMLRLQDSPSGAADFLARQISNFGRRVSRDETIARIAAITTADVKHTANNVINDEDHALAAIGPIFELPDYNWIRRRSYWQRY